MAAKSDTSASRFVTRAELAKGMNASTRTVDKWIRAGLPRARSGPHGRNKEHHLFDLFEVAAWFRQQATDARKEARGLKKPAGQGDEFALKMQSLKLAKLELDLEERRQAIEAKARTLVPVAELESFSQAWLAFWGKRVEAARWTLVGEALDWARETAEGLRSMVWEK